MRFRLWQRDRARWRATVLSAFFLSACATGPAHAQKAGREPAVSVTADGDSAGGRIDAQIKITATAETVWSTMLDCAVSLRIVSGLKTCRVVERDPGGKWDVREHVVAWSALLPTVRSVFRSEYQFGREIRFSRVSGDLKKLEGQWQLTPSDGGRATLLRYMAVVDPGVPLPGALVRSAIESDVTRVLKALQAEAEARNVR
jgi:Polyketide cyclase / dehydrase and lipid transport